VKNVHEATKRQSRVTEHGIATEDDQVCAAVIVESLNGLMRVIEGGVSARACLDAGICLRLVEIPTVRFLFMSVYVRLHPSTAEANAPIGKRRVFDDQSGSGALTQAPARM